MNRIILIGNGFDLSCGLKTSYSHFIDWFWKKQIKYYSENKYISDLKDLIRLSEENISKYSRTPLSPFNADSFKPFKDALQRIFLFDIDSIEFQNKLLEIVSKNNMEKWVDIEEEYYLQLKKIIQKEQRVSYSEKYKIEDLNSDLEKIKIELEEYLIEELKKHEFRFKWSNLEDCFNVLDFTSKGLGELRQRYFSETKEKQNEFDQLLSEAKKAKTHEAFCRTHVNPEDTLFLNFNYTDLTDKIIQSIYKNQWQLDDWAKSKFETIHIHGELNNPSNPMIFGYGDENDELHKEIEKRGGEYLNNIKTINYLKTGNYKRLLRFIESDMFQVFIFGHSCGFSDKTLLKTLFEHKNCVSIKPFFYVDKDRKSNYDDIIKNIYRIFSDKALMREKVVNEKYCKQLEQCKS